MTTIPNFDTANDLKVEFFLPNLEDNAFIVGISLLGGENVLSNGGQFIIGESLLGGEDVLGGLGFTWQNLGCSTANAQLSIGGSVQDDLYFQAQPAQANITLQTYQYDPSANSAFRPGVPVRIRLEKDLTNQIIWSGVVDTIGARYEIEGKNLMRVVAYDNMKNLLNTRLPLFDSETVEGFVTPYEQMELIAEQFGTSMHSTSTETGGEIPSQLLENVIPNVLVFDAIQVGQALFWLDPVTQEFVFVPRPDPSILPDFPVGAGYFTLGTSLLGGADVLGSGNPVYTVGNNHETFYHLCMSNIDTMSDGDTVFNSLKVTLKDDDTTSVLVEDEDSISLYGRYAQDVTLNTTTEAELTRWANAVFNQSPTNLVQSVETLTRDRTGTLTEAAFLLPGELLGVDFEQDILHIKDYYTITKVSHYIDPDTWLTTLDLWKEA